MFAVTKYMFLKWQLIFSFLRRFVISFITETMLSGLDHMS